MTAGTTWMGNLIVLPWLSRLGLTLVHTLWEAAVAAGGLLVLLLACRRARPEVRYRLAYLSLAAVCAAGVVTFAVLPVDRPAQPRGEVAARPTVRAGATRFVGHETFDQAAITAGPAPVATASATAALRPASWLPLIAEGWLIGTVLLLGFRVIGWAMVHRQLAATTPVDAGWAAELAIFQASVGVAHPVRWLTTERARVPFVAGWRRPAVVIPAAVRQALSPEELHAVLRHELAHVRRGDYPANLLQTALETLLFFHPAAAWMSRLIRGEREHCCDDLAVRQGGSVAVYARALGRLEAMRQPELGWAITMAASGTSLVPRLRRLLEGRTRNPFNARLALGLGIAAAAMPFASVRLMAQVGTSAGASTMPPTTLTTMPATQAAVVYTPSPQQAAFLKLCGSGTMGRLATPLLQQFSVSHPTVLTQTALYGSHWVSEELLNPSDHWANVGLMSRPMNAEEHGQFRQRTGHDPLEILIARDGILILVNQKNALPGITLPQLDALYGTDRRAGFVGPAKMWGDLGATGDLAAMPIDPYGLLEQDQGTVETFRRIVLLGGPINTHIRNIPLPENEFGQAVADDPGGISYNIDHAPVPGARALPVAAAPGKAFVAATEATIGNGSYPLSRGLYLYISDRSDPLADDFVRFVLSSGGQAIIAGTKQAAALPPDVAAEELNHARL